jgi:hypothetical protein
MGQTVLILLARWSTPCGALRGNMHQIRKAPPETRTNVNVDEKVTDRRLKISVYISYLSGALQKSPQLGERRTINRHAAYPVRRDSVGDYIAVKPCEATEDPESQGEEASEI